MTLFADSSRDPELPFSVAPQSDLLSEVSQFCPVMHCLSWLLHFTLSVMYLPPDHASLLPVVYLNART